MTSKEPYVDGKTFATFRATDFPDEAEWTATGSPLVPDGRSVCGALATALRSKGHTASEPAQHSFYGWAFTVNANSHTLWCLLQGGEPWLLRVEEKVSAWRRFIGRADPNELRTLLRSVDESLKADPRFSDIRWFTKIEYEAGGTEGAATPF